MTNPPTPEDKIEVVLNKIVDDLFGQYEDGAEILDLTFSRHALLALLNEVRALELQNIISIVQLVTPLSKYANGDFYSIKDRIDALRAATPKENI